MSVSAPSGATPAGLHAVDVTRLIDDAPISRFQVSVFLLCASVVFLDGVDTQIMGIAAPVVSAEQGIARPLLGWLFATGTLGATVGAFACGLLADRIGRKAVLVAATAWFGVATLATVLADGFVPFLLFRFATGLGLGGAVPCFVALTSEYAPARRRAAIVSLLWAAFPLGGMAGGFVNAYLLHVSGWRTLFLVWGAVPVLTALALAVWLPESVRFLLARHADGALLRRIVGRIAPGGVGDGMVAGSPRLAAAEADLPGFALRHLFTDGRAAGTVPLWVASFLVFGMLVVIASWTPAMLTALQFRPSEAALVVAFNGFGSFVGTSVAGRLMERFGAGRSLVPGFALAALATMLYGSTAGSFAGVGLASFVAGALLGLSSSGIVALSALAYPTAIRSTGIGWALGVGRFGSVVGPIVVGAMIGMQWPLPQIWVVLGCALLLAVPCVWFLARSGTGSAGLPHAAPARGAP